MTLDCPTHNGLCHLITVTSVVGIRDSPIRCYETLDGDRLPCAKSGGRFGPRLQSLFVSPSELYSALRAGKAKSAIKSLCTHLAQQQIKAAANEPISGSQLSAST